MRLNSGVSLPPSPPPSEASDGAVTEAHSCRDPERQEHSCCFVPQIVHSLNKKNCSKLYEDVKP